jgi:hypothetical protein
MGYYICSTKYWIQVISQKQQYTQKYIKLVGLHISTLNESSSGPQDTDPYKAVQCIVGSPTMH